MSSRAFTGDLADGTFSAFTTVQNKNMVDRGQGKQGLGIWYPANADYPARAVSYDPDCGYAARLELRDGDIAVSGERTVCSTGPTYKALIGTTRWYAFSIKFDDTYPLNRGALGWGNIAGWKDAETGFTTATIAFGWPASQAGTTWAVNEVGYWWLFHNPQNPPFTYTGASTPDGSISGTTIPVFKLPIDPGNWQDLKFAVKIAQDNTGTVRLWRNGIPQTVFGGGSSTVFTGQTCPPSAPGVTFNITDASGEAEVIQGAEIVGTYSQVSMYRDAAYTNGTEILSFANYRQADSEDGL